MAGCTYRYGFTQLSESRLRWRIFVGSGAYLLLLMLLVLLLGWVEGLQMVRSVAVMTAVYCLVPVVIPGRPRVAAGAAILIALVFLFAVLLDASSAGLLLLLPQHLLVIVLAALELVSAVSAVEAVGRAISWMPPLREWMSEGP